MTYMKGKQGKTYSCFLTSKVCKIFWGWSCTFTVISLNPRCVASAQGSRSPPQKSTWLQGLYARLRGQMEKRTPSPWLLTFCHHGSGEPLEKYLIFAVRKDVAWRSWYSFAKWSDYLQSFAGFSFSDPECTWWYLSMTFNSIKDKTGVHTGFCYLIYCFYQCKYSILTEPILLDSQSIRNHKSPRIKPLFSQT